MKRVYTHWVARLFDGTFLEKSPFQYMRTNEIGNAREYPTHEAAKHALDMSPGLGGVPVKVTVTYEFKVPRKTYD